MLDLTTEENAVWVPVKIVPGASRTRYLGPWQGRARIAVAAPAEKGRANKAVIAFFADLVSVRKGDVTIIAGQTSPTKMIRIEGVALEVVRTALQPDRS